MAEIRLSGRLKAIARLVPPSGGMADIGTDHGYLPIYLFKKGFEGTIIATDIKPGPLDSARRSAKEHGLDGTIDFHLCDGLRGIDGSTIATVVIAGMGGETIASILEDAPWTKEGGRLLVLQPMSKSDRLRSWLFENGYKVLTEELIKDGAVYELFSVSGGNDAAYCAGELLTGHFQLISGDPLFPERLDRLISKQRRAADGLSSSNDLESHKRLEKINEILGDLYYMKERSSLDCFTDKG